MPNGRSFSRAGGQEGSGRRNRGPAGSSRAPAASLVPASGGFLTEDARVALQCLTATVRQLFGSSASHSDRSPAWQVLDARDTAALALDLALVNDFLYHVYAAARAEYHGAVLRILDLDQGAAVVELLRLATVAARLPWHTLLAPYSSGGAAGIGAGPNLSQHQHDVVTRAWHLVMTIMGSGHLGPPSQRHLDIAHRMLRAQSLQAIAQQLAAAANDMASLPPETQQLAVSFLESSLMLLRNITVVTVQWPHLANAVQQQQMLADELVEAVCSSRFTEHAARLLVALMMRADEGRTEETSRAALYYLFSYAEFAYLGAPPGTHPRALVNEIQGSPCTNFVALLLSLAALVAADGGPVYGIPAGLLCRVPVAYDDPSEQSLPQEQGVKRLHPGTCLPLLWAVHYGRGLRRLGRRAARSLALRWARLAVATARYDAAAIGPAGGSSGSGGSGGCGSGGAARGGGTDADADASGRRSSYVVLLTKGSTVRIAQEALAIASNNLPPTSQPHPPGDLAAVAAADAHYVAEAAEWWRTALGAVRHARGGAAAQDLRRLGGLLVHLLRRPQLGAGPGPGPVTSVDAPPPPEVRAALAGGLLPGLESILRAAGRARGAPEREIVAGLLDHLAEGVDRTLPGLGLQLWRYLAPLLAHGEPRQAAALVVSIGKLLRVSVSRIVEGSSWPLSEGRPFENNLVGLLVGPFLSTAAATTAQSSGEWAADGGNQEQQQQQQHHHHPRQLPPPPSQAAADLALALSCGVSEWLPQLAELQRRLPMLPKQGAVLAGEIAELMFVRWLPLLSQACMAEEGPAAAAGCQRGAPAAYSSGTPAAGKAVGTSSSNDSDSSSHGLSSSSAPAGSSSSSVGLGSGGGSGSAAAGSWRWFLTEVLGAAELLRGMTLKVDLTCGQIELATLINAARACCTLAAACPEEVLLRRLETRAARRWAPDTSVFSPAILSSLASKLERRGEQANADAVYDLIRLLRDAELERRGDSGGGGWRRRILGHPALAQLRSRVRDGWPVPLVTPGEVRRRLQLLLPRCANAACIQLEGDSEAEVALRACGRCGAVRYCCKDCQTAHWRAGHKADCSGRGPGGQQAGGSGAADEASAGR